MKDMRRSRTNAEGVATMGFQISVADPATARRTGGKKSGLSAEEQRMADNAKRIRADAADGNLEDLTGLCGKELMARLLRK